MLLQRWALYQYAMYLHMYRYVQFMYSMYAIVGLDPGWSPEVDYHACNGFPVERRSFQAAASLL
jgi:hypothetical protein